jgi:TonB family protein
MKTMLKIFVVLAGVALLQGCQSAETKDTSAAIAKTDAAAADAKRVEERAFKKKQLEKQTAEKTAQREKARAEKLQASATYKDSTGRLVYHRAEIDPAYSGGNDEMRAFLKKNLKYPEAAKEKGFEGTVFVDFVIDEKGRVRNVIATDVVGEDVDFSLKEESVRVVASMPLWKPGMQHGKSVDTSFSIPITFEID